MTARGHDEGELLAIVARWIADDPDEDTREELEQLVALADLSGLEERFARPLEFGTAGLRGPLGAGPGRMNRLLVRRTTAGLCRFLLGQSPALTAPALVVGRDARHGSAAFAAEVATVAASHGFAVLVLGGALPTPITAFAVRRLGAVAGVMVTASHNPASDNGYKVYLADGAQIAPPHDAAVAAAAAAEVVVSETGGGGPLAANRSGTTSLVDEHELLADYRSAVLAVLADGSRHALEVVYTPLHGVGGAVLPSLFEAAGFRPPRLVAEQADPDPDFPTLRFPNPEEPGVLELAIAEAMHSNADIVLANDPDADRLAVAVPDSPNGAWRALSGDEVGILLADDLLERSHGDDRLVATTIVSSSMLRALAAEHHVAYVETLTGFKWIARAAHGRPGRRLLFGYEEALGYAVSDAVADKDGLSAAVLVADLAARSKEAGGSLLRRLDELAARLGVHATAQWSIRLEGGTAAAQMARILERWRSDPPQRIAGLDVTEHVDLAHGSSELPPTDAVILRAGERARIVVRPSGTEPKLKAYLEITTSPPGAAALAEARRDAARQLTALRDEVARRSMD